MNKRLKKDFGKHVAEQRGWHHLSGFWLFFFGLAAKLESFLFTILVWTSCLREQQQ